MSALEKFHFTLSPPLKVKYFLKMEEDWKSQCVYTIFSFPFTHRNSCNHHTSKEAQRLQRYGPTKMFQICIPSRFVSDFRFYQPSSQTMLFLEGVIARFYIVADVLEILNLSKVYWLVPRDSVWFFVEDLIFYLF